MEDLSCFVGLLKLKIHPSSSIPIGTWHDWHDPIINVYYIYIFIIEFQFELPKDCNICGLLPALSTLRGQKKSELAS